MNQQQYDCPHCGTLTFKESMGKEDIKHSIQIHRSVHEMMDKGVIAAGFAVTVDTVTEISDKPI